MQHVYRTLLAAAMIALLPVALLSATAQEEEQPRWFGSDDGRSTMLLYGVPDSDYVMLHFSCAIGKPVVNVHVQDEESSAEEGAAMHVRLSAGGRQVAFSGKAISNEDSGGKDVKGELPLNDTLRAILAAKGTLEIVVDGHTQRYDMDGAAEPAVVMLAACDAPMPAGDLDVMVTNKARRPLQSFAWSEAGVNSFDSDAFGYDPLESGASRTFTISGGREACTFDVSVSFAEEDDEECCSDLTPAGTQNLCENSTFVVHD
ncbi:hypothetical protein ACTDI4_03555 [Mesorhizobium sp. PUT5]|uniref:hypothetical protein n=1 Tax=Mesorhizobium sp. PUT5 TaxID=3454629 RepID=UPI003FA46697